MDKSWYKKYSEIIDPVGKTVIDIGCGGGIYSRAWLELGAKNIIGIDFSEKMIQAAIETSNNYNNISYQVGNAISTGLSEKIGDIVFERALIHHVSDLYKCFKEAYRLLKPGGLYIIQDRTPEDVNIVGSKDHIRGYFFEKFPHLLKIEYSRRPQSNEVENKLKDANFTDIKTYNLWETRKIYNNFSEFTIDLRNRTARSILHELNNEELENLITYISNKITDSVSITEKDCWTIWTGVR
ncbi:MAG: class I SAM-dependent methyltransferase [Promethearchaeota archaeon]